MRISDWSSDVCSSDLLKIRAMSSESKASAYIIGVLPFTVFGLICYINYDYMSPFFTPDPAGLFGLSTMQVIGIGGMCWMSNGAFILAQMLNFEILGCRQDWKSAVTGKRGEVSVSPV